MNTVIEVRLPSPVKTNESFVSRWEKISNEIEYNPEWENGTGYFNHAIRIVKLAPAEYARSISPKGCRIVFIGTRIGTVVVFERYTDSNVVVCNAPVQLRAGLIPWFGGSSLSKMEIEFFIGDVEAGKNFRYNIGNQVEAMFALAEKAA